MAYGAQMVNDGRGTKKAITPQKVGALTVDLSNVRNALRTQAQNAAASPIANVPKNAGVKVTGSTIIRNTGTNTGSSTPTVTESYSGGGGGGGGWGIDYSSILAQLQAAANEAYNRAKSSLDTTLNSTLGGLLDSYNSQKDVLQKKYDSSKQTLDDDNEAALRQAYINKMINARDLNQLLTAQGLTGGQSETTTANMLNNYANNRNSLNKTYATNLRELLTGHEGLLADALTAYNDKVAQARQAYSGYLAQLEQNRMNAIASALPSFSQLTSLLG